MLRAGLMALLVGIFPPLAAAQTSSGEKPDLVLEAPEAALGVEQKIDLENIVLGAAKAVTTIQEAPGILTVISRDEIQRRGFRTLNETLTFVPGWQNGSLIFRSTDVMLTRGAAQSQLLLRDGISLMDPAINVMTIGQAVPLEMIKRVEVVTGPGGVLWGANSFMGIISILTRDASDVNGFEASAGYGGGFCSQSSLTPCGDSNDFKVYGIYGKAWGKLAVIQHVSFQTYQGPQFAHDQMMNHSPSPQPLGPTLYGAPGLSNTPQSFMLNVDGKVTYGPFSVGYTAPWGRLYRPLHFGGGYVQTGDGRRWDATQVGAAMAPGGYCNDPANPLQAQEHICRDPYGLTRKSAWNLWDTLAYARYKDTLAKDRLGVDVKGYYTNFKRSFGPTQILPAWLPLLQGGLMFATDPRVERMGGTVDLDLKIRNNLRLLFGAEGFRESVRDGDTYFTSPWPQGLPLACPWTDATLAKGNMGKVGPVRDPRDYPVGAATPEGLASQCPIAFVFNSDRVVTAGYVDLQFKPYDKLMLEAGYRAQAAPAGKRTYGLQNLASGAAVFQFLPDFHLKVNYASGFRPPVFQNTDSNGEGVNYTSSPHLKPETSQSVQGEINARVLRNVRRVQGLTLRADYSYTILDNLIRVINGHYQNSGQRGIHSAEFLAKLHLVGDHQLFMTYTYLRAMDSTDGEMRNVPNHWLTAGAVFTVIKRRLSVNTNLTISGAYEDVNRYIRPNANLLFGGKIARVSDQTFDRLPPQAVWQLGVRLYGLWKDRLSFDANVYNALNQRYFLSDGFYDFTARMEQRPNPADSLAFFVGATMQY
ncbi:MAG: TonB-dependent receptor [Deltaproteobacteria bacterium]|nr:TonB-dependent receptor [Deltaproteobacteria bacterium]